MAILKLECEQRIKERDCTLACRPTWSKGGLPAFHRFAEGRKLHSPQCIEKAIPATKRPEQSSFSHARCGGYGVHCDCPWQVGASEESFGGGKHKGSGDRRTAAARTVDFGLPVRYTEILSIRGH